MKPLADKPAIAAVSPEKIGLFDDVPKWIWVMFLSGWVAVFGLFVLFFTRDDGAIFAVTIAVLFATMAFGLPMTMAAQSKCAKHDCKGVVHTRSGPLSAGAAAIQIALIPIAAAIGLIALITLAL